MNVGVPIIGRTAMRPVAMAQAPVQPWSNDEEAEAYVADPRAFLLAKCNDFMGNIELFHNRVMLATYYLPAFQELPGGIRFHRADVTLDEATWQGKVGLVIAKGKLAFMDDERVKFYGQNVDIGDWVYFDRHDGRQLTINRVHCRSIRDVEIVGKVRDPNLVY